MNRPTRALAAAVIVAAGAVTASQAFAGPTATAGAPIAATTTAEPTSTNDRGGQRRDFDRFLERYEAANTAFVNGDPSQWLAMVTEREPASIFGGFGGLGSAGVTDVFQRYHLAAGAFRPSGAEIEFDYLVKDVQGRLAYTVAIERGEVLYAGQTELQPHVLRVTMLFRYERGGWKIVHRHADTMIDLVLPTG